MNSKIRKSRGRWNTLIHIGWTHFIRSEKLTTLFFKLLVYIDIMLRSFSLFHTFSIWLYWSFNHKNFIRSAELPRQKLWKQNYTLEDSVSWLQDDKTKLEKFWFVNFFYILNKKKQGIGNLGIDWYPKVTETVMLMNHS